MPKDLTDQAPETSIEHHRADQAANNFHTTLYTVRVQKRWRNMFQLGWPSLSVRVNNRCILLYTVLVLALYFKECKASTLPLSSGVISIGENNLQPLNILRRFPIAILDTSKASIGSFVQTAGVMVPAGMIWKLGILRSSGMKPWVMEGGR